MKSAVLFSGGKDSVMALNYAINNNNLLGSLLKKLEIIFNKLDLERQLYINNNYS